jgi:hypothetical protein
LSRFLWRRSISLIINQQNAKKKFCYACLLSEGIIIYFSYCHIQRVLADQQSTLSNYRTFINVIFSDSYRRFQSSRKDRRLSLLANASLIWLQLISTKMIGISVVVDRTLPQMSTIIICYKTNNQNEYIQMIEPNVIVDDYLVTIVYKSATIPLKYERNKEIILIFNSISC